MKARYITIIEFLIILTISFGPAMFFDFRLLKFMFISSSFIAGLYVSVILIIKQNQNK